MATLVEAAALLERGRLVHAASKDDELPPALPPVRVKVLGDGEITKALTVQVDKVSASAKAKIEAAGGKVEEPC